jgi:hypothetical protein
VEPAQLAKTARASLATALNTLQASDDVPDELIDLAEPIAKAMAILHKIERSGGTVLDGSDVVLKNVRTVLEQVQATEVSHPAVDTVLEAVASSLSKVRQLAKAASAGAAQPAAAPAKEAPAPAPAAQEKPAPAPVAAAPAPQPVVEAKPEPKPAPQPVVEAKPEPKPAPQPAVEAKPVVELRAAELAPAPQPVIEPKPVIAPQPAIEPKPVVELKPEPKPVAQPAPEPKPVAQPAPEPRKEAAPEPKPAQAAKAAPEPKPAQATKATPEPKPVQAPKAEPTRSKDPPIQAPPGSRSMEVELGTHSASNFYKGLGGNDVIEHGGIFVATYRVPKLGSSVLLRVLLPGDYEFQATAVVQWTRESGESSEPGFGARFTQIGPEGRQLVYRYARNREPMFYDDL